MPNNDLDGILPDQALAKKKYEDFFSTDEGKDFIKKVNSIKPVREIDNLINKKIKVLDDGFICLIDYMGNDLSIAQAARVSYGQGTKTVSEDETLIRYLMRHRHTTPFEMCQIKFLIRMPMDCHRQQIRHRSASVNEYSTRYSVAIDSAQKTKSSDWRKQSTNNKQGSGEYLNEELGSLLSKLEHNFHEQARGLYEHRLELGVAREQARKDLPLSTYTEYYWNMDLKNLLDYLTLRMDSHAQFEIRQYANAIAEIVKVWVPITYKAFEDYRLNSMVLSAKEVEIIRSNLGFSDLELKNNGMTNKRERDEFRAKLLKLGKDIE